MPANSYSIVSWAKYKPLLYVKPLRVRGFIFLLQHTSAYLDQYKIYSHINFISLQNIQDLLPHYHQHLESSDIFFSFPNLRVWNTSLLFKVAFLSLVNAADNHVMFVRHSSSFLYRLPIYWLDFCCFLVGLYESLKTRY